MIQVHVNNMWYKWHHWLYYHGCCYIPGQFLRQKEVSFDILYYGALHVFYNFKHSLHIVKLSSVKSTKMARIPGCQAISPRLLHPRIRIKLKAQYSNCLLYTNTYTSKWCKFILKWLQHVSALIYHLQGVYKLCLLNSWIIKMIKYNIVVHCYDKISVNVAAYVIPG